MSIKRMLNSKKAISPILATLLLIVIAVAAIVVTYAWITTYIGNTTQQAGFMPYKANVAFRVRVGIDRHRQLWDLKRRNSSGLRRRFGFNTGKQND